MGVGTYHNRGGGAGRGGASGREKLHKTLHEFKHGTLHSGSKQGPKVTSRKQAVAIALNQQRRANRGRRTKRASRRR